MAKGKISKNLSDADMFKGYKEELTFETGPAEQEEKPAKRSNSAKAPDLHTSFFTPELQEQVGKALLEIKLQLYKEGIVDYTIKVSRDGRKVILTAVEQAKTKK